MNRQTRRMMQVEAVNLGRKLAASCLDYSPDGGLVRVVDIRAVRVLERAFTLLLWRGCKPLVVQIAAADAAAFPRRDGVPQVAEATPWLAVGMDGQGRANYALRWLWIDGKALADEQGIAELAMLAELSRETARHGFPMDQAMGRA